MLILTSLLIVPDSMAFSLTPSYFDGDDPPEEPAKTVKVAKIEVVKVKEEEAELKIDIKKEKVDRDLEYLAQEIDRTPSLDEELKRDLQSKRQNSKYLEMLVRDTERRRWCSAFYHQGNK